jgi:hypothetical protein
LIGLCKWVYFFNLKTTINIPTLPPRAVFCPSGMKRHTRNSLSVKENKIK